MGDFFLIFANDMKPRTATVSGRKDGKRLKTHEGTPQKGMFVFLEPLFSYDAHMFIYVHLRPKYSVEA